MGCFPFFVELEGKEGLIVGGGRIAVHKAGKLLPFAPKITVIAIIWEERPFREDDLEGKYFVIAATAETELNAHISNLCQKKGILVNVVDDKEKCGFLFPALMRTGKLTVGVSTEGASPGVAAAVKNQLISELPNQMDAILDYLETLREPSKERIADSKVRAVFLKEAASCCMEYNRPLTEEETERLYVKCTHTALECEEQSGSVTLVGAGCGPYDLITVRGLNAVQRAEVLVYDDLMDRRLVEFTAESCEKIYVGKRMGAHSMKQEQIQELLLEKAKEGKRVVRLKGGDPFVFGRGGEEILFLKKEGIKVQEIPGITSSIAVPAEAGIPVTERGIARSFHVITGHTSDTEDRLPEDMEYIARLQGTCIFLMGFGQLEAIVKKLTDFGKAVDTPVAVLHGNYDGTVEEVRGTLADITDKVAASELATPAVIVVGQTAAIHLWES
jgi:uroporphyrin-III C-methyltransferase/precorrin-2 dehydrogenase/sirohydrochlorin ferrochelatase